MPPIHGRVIETRGDTLVIRRGTDPVEYEHECPGHNAAPGDYVLIEDGSAEVTGRQPPQPEDIPVPGPEHDHR